MKDPSRRRPLTARIASEQAMAVRSAALVGAAAAIDHRPMPAAMNIVALTGFIAIFFTAPNIKVLLVGEILAGIPWGVFQTLCITYVSEVCPVALRGYLTAYVNMCWGIGQLMWVFLIDESDDSGVGVIKAMLGRTDEWAYRLPYGLQWSE